MSCGCPIFAPFLLASRTFSGVRYNLGWLPGGDKSITTKLEDTLKSIEGAKPLVKHGGMISIMLYRGHAEVSASHKVLVMAGVVQHTLFEVTLGSA